MKEESEPGMQKETDVHQSDVSSITHDPRACLPSSPYLLQQQQGTNGPHPHHQRKNHPTSSRSTLATRYTPQQPSKSLLHASIEYSVRLVIEHSFRTWLRSTSTKFPSSLPVPFDPAMPWGKTWTRQENLSSKKLHVPACRPCTVHLT